MIGLLCITIAKAALWDNVAHIWPLNTTYNDDLIGGKNLLNDSVHTNKSVGMNPIGSFNTRSNKGEVFYYTDFNEDTSPFTMNFWVNISLIESPGFYIIQTGLGPLEISATQNSTGVSRMNFNSNCGSWNINYTPNKYYMMTWLLNHSKSRIWMNGTMMIDDTTNCSSGMMGTLTLGDNANPGNVTIDELYIWNRSLSNSEVTSLYNGSYGLFYPSDVTSSLNSISLNSPANNTYSNAAIIDFKFTPSINLTSAGCFLYYNQSDIAWTLLAANATPIINITENTISSTISDRHLKWNIKCNTTDGQYIWGENNLTLKIDTVMPSLTIYSPQNNSYFTNSFYVDSICTDTSIYILNYTFYNSTMILNSSQVNTTNGTSLSLNITYNINQYKTGIYTLNISCSDGHTSSLFQPVADIKVSTSKIDYKFDDDEIGVEIISDEKLIKLNTSKKTDRYIIDMEFEKPVDNFKYKLTGSKFVRYTSKYKGHIIIDDKYWFDTEPYAAEVVEVGKGYIILDVEVNGKSKLATESIGGLNINVTTLQLRFGYYRDISFDSSALEYGISTMNIYLGNRTVDGTINLIYNNTRYTASQEVYDALSGYTKFTFQPVAPQVSADSNVSFYFNYTYSDGITGVTETFNQTVKNFGIYECIGAEVPVLVMTFYDESALYLINVSAQANIELIGIPSVNSSFTPINFTNKYNESLCLTPANTSLNVNAYILFQANSGFTHRYYIVNETLSNITTYLKLYNFNSSTGTSILNGILRDYISYEIYSDIYASLYRYYPAENSWKLVQMSESDVFGQIYFNIIENSVDYNIMFKDSHNRNLGQTGKMTMACNIGICSLTLLVNSAITSSTTFSSAYSFNNATSLITLSYIDTTGESHTVNLQASKGGSIICSNSTIGAMGTLKCDITGYSGTILVSAYKQSSKLPFLYTYIERPIGELWEVASKYSGDLVFMSLGIVITTTMAGAPLGVGGAIIGALIGFIAIFFLKTMYIPISIFVGAIIFLIIVASKGEQQ
jgi:hypothetical protein